MNNVEPRQIKGIFVDLKAFREWKVKRQKISLVVDERKKICRNCHNPISENEKICPYCSKFVGGSFDGRSTE